MATFDDEADHGLRGADVHRAWRALLQRWLPAPPATVLDAGCGTGSLSVLVAGLGHAVTGIDFAPAMLAVASAKAERQGVAIEFQRMDAANPQFPLGSFDVILCRHVLWALPDWPTVLQRWAALLKPNGRLLLIEGSWETGGGLRAEAIKRALPPHCEAVALARLSDDPAYWGRAVSDERYLLVVESP